ncbi:WD repeat domain protein [Reticulomyxa filosa]|uniref:WD repeat domain protein n=1 Tax=Reticulomyxa filosa TaxID=46433 RepID=X6MKA0_RETFI|nr:WD repeat domain protein [Reticulomyxa filosa]|eukprot:ETO14418.1 WD repeat domain protein [Reticulomyxa filosa]
MENIKIQLNEKQNLEKLSISQLYNDINKIKQQNILTKTIITQECNKELIKLKNIYDNILKNEKTQTLELRSNNGILKREFAGLQQKIKQGNDKLQKLLNEQNILIENINKLEKDIEGYEYEIKERNITVIEKNQIIKDIFDKNQDLEKFKFVLDHKINELNNQIKPKDIYINNIQQQIIQMNNEIKYYNSNNHLLQSQMKDLKLKIKSLQYEYNYLCKNNIYVNSLIKNIGQELECLYLLKEEDNHFNNNQLKKGIKLFYFHFKDILFQNLITTENQNDNDGNINIQFHDEFQRQRIYLEKTIQSLQKRLEQDQFKFKKNSDKILQENVILIQEINQLRREIAIIVKGR